MTARHGEIVTRQLAGAIRQGGAIDTSAAGAFVGVPIEQADADDLIYRVVGGGLREFSVEDGDLLIIEPRSDGNAATAELVLASLDQRLFVGRWWTKRGRRALLGHALQPIAEHEDLRVLGAVTVVIREHSMKSRRSEQP